MKLAKLSLAAIVVAGLASSSFAASDTLADAFKNGKVSGELKAWYFDKTVENATFAPANKAQDRSHNANIANFGVTLGYVTDSLYGFRLGTTFQGSSTPFANDEAKGYAGTHSSPAANSANFSTTNAASGATLSEAYLGYALGKTDVKIGRQFISTPLVNGSGSRFFKESFEGALIVNTDLPQTTLIGGYVNKFQGRTSAIDDATDLGNNPQFHKSAVFAGLKNTGIGTDYTEFDGAYTLGVINKSITNLALTAQYAIVKDVADIADVDVYYTEANYVLPVAGFKLGFDANFRGSKTDSALDALNADGKMYAGRISIKELAGFGASFAAATTSTNDHVILGLGNGPTTYTATMIAGAATPTAGANTDSYLVELTYDFSKIGVTGLTAVAQYAWTSQGDIPQSTMAGVQTVKNGTDRTTYAAGVTYAVPALKGLTTSLQYETQEAEFKGANEATTHKTNDTDELWFKANYKF